MKTNITENTIVFKHALKAQNQLHRYFIDNFPTLIYNGYVMTQNLFCFFEIHKYGGTGMKKRTRLITLTLAILTVISCFAACGNKSDETTEKAISNSNLDEYGRDYIADSVPQDLRFDGETVTFFTRNDTDYWKIEMDAEYTTNDTLNDAVFYRNATVEDRLGITIEQIQQAGAYGPHTQWFQSLRNSVLTKTGDYDCAAVYASQGSALATEGIEALHTWSSWRDIIMLALVCTVLSDYTLILAIKRIGSTKTSILGSMEPLTAVVVGVVYFGERVDAVSIVGLVLIICAVVVVIVQSAPNRENN